MSSSRKPGALGLNPEVQDLNDGTMIRGLSPRPGPIGVQADSFAGDYGKPLVTRRASRKNVASSISAGAIGKWSLEDKFAEALRRTAPKLPGGMRREFEALLSPTSLKIMAGTLVIWAGSHAFGVGEAADLVLLAGGVFFLGMAVFDVAGELGDFLVVTYNAADEKDLDEAASHLARAIAIMGVAAFIALLAKVARGRGGKGGATEAPAESPPPETPATRSSTRPKTMSQPSAKLAKSMSKLRAAEQRTAQRLADGNPEFNGRTFEAPPPPDPGYDWFDDLGRTYDAMGDGTTSKYLKLDEFTESIDSHLLKGNDFTVIDMTGYTADQIAAVERYVKALPADKQLLIRRVGF